MNQMTSYFNALVKSLTSTNNIVVCLESVPVEVLKKKKKKKKIGM